MTTSSVPKDYLTTSSDTITITSLDSIDLSSIASMNTSISYPSSYTHPVGAISISSTIPTLTTSQLSSLYINTSDYGIKISQDWEDCFPDWDRVQKMCKEYPGLQIAFEKFKTTYKLVKDHYDTPADQRPRP